jgi:16S rRNA (uracil1498-N3)-methyltransferase
MHRLFIAPEQIDGHTARITGSDHMHLAKVLRARTGQAIVLLDGQGNAFRATLTNIERRESTARIEEDIVPPSEPVVFITVGQALGKSDKFEQVVQHGTESGASAFVPIRAERCVVEIPDDRLPERVGRWRTIAKSASEQSFRSRIPTVGPPVKFEACIRAALETRTRLLLLHTEVPAIPLWVALTRGETRVEQALILVGPEGGWSSKEIELAAELGCELISLGPRILRTETAALVAISQLLYHYSRPQEFTSCVS